MIERTTQARDEPGRRGLDRRLVLGGGVVLLTGPGCPASARQAAPPPAAGPDAPPPDALSLSANLLTRMAAAVRLNGSRPRLFVLDTGAERTSIARDLAEALGLAPGPTVVVHGITSAAATPTVLVDRLNFGRRRFNHMVMPVFERSLLAADGLLGLDQRFKGPVAGVTLAF